MLTVSEAKLFSGPEKVDSLILVLGLSIFRGRNSTALLSGFLSEK
jgi:hypothetical protein